jgi:hypothetical protein
LSLLAGLLLIATALLAALPGLLLSRLAWLLSATALLAGFVVRVHNCSLFSPSNCLRPLTSRLGGSRWNLNGHGKFPYCL